MWKPTQAARRHGGKQRLEGKRKSCWRNVLGHKQSMPDCNGLSVIEEANAKGPSRSQLTQVVSDRLLGWVGRLLAFAAGEGVTAGPVCPCCALRRARGRVCLPVGSGRM